MKLQNQPEADYKSPATLMDDNGQSLANVHVNFSPTLHRGEFRLPPSANTENILGATSLQTGDGRLFRITDLKLCKGYHTIGPDQPHYEFLFQPA